MSDARAALTGMASSFNGAAVAVAAAFEHLKAFQLHATEGNWKAAEQERFALHAAMDEYMDCYAAAFKRVGA